MLNSLTALESHPLGQTAQPLRRFCDPLGITNCSSVLSWWNFLLIFDILTEFYQMSCFNKEEHLHVHTCMFIFFNILFVFWDWKTCLTTYLYSVNIKYLNWDPIHTDPLLMRVSKLCLKILRRSGKKAIVILIVILQNEIAFRRRVVRSCEVIPIQWESIRNTFILARPGHSFGVPLTEADLKSSSHLCGAL